MARTRAVTWLAIGLPIVLVALVVSAWAVDVGVSGGEIIRNTRLGERGIGGQEEDEVLPTVMELAEEYETADVRIRTPEETFASTAGELGLSLDPAATVASALDVGRDGPLHERFFGWLGSFVTPAETPLHFAIEEVELSAELVELQGESRLQPVEPLVVGTPSTVGIEAGRPGVELDPATVATALRDAAETGEVPIVVDAEPVERDPRYTDDQARELAAQAEEFTAAPLEVRAGDQVTTVNPDVLRSWITSVPGPEALQLALDERKAIEDLVVRLPDTAREPADASFTVADGVPVLQPSVTGTACCVEGTGPALLDALGNLQPNVEVELRTTEPEFTTADAEALGIRERVGTQGEWAGRPFDREFTTYFASGQSRVTNIQRMADLVRGAVIPPGGSFSLNDHVGERTTAGGFVPGGFIENGVLVEAIGGGVSQFATTIFNTAFFAGLEFGEYQSHSLVIDRYPYGREATVSFPNPDLVIENPSPYGVLIWTSFTDSSITVTFYSTPWAVGAQTGQSSSGVGPCTRVTTERTRTFVDDGHTEVDTVTALYRPGEGIDC